MDWKNSGELERWENKNSYDVTLGKMLETANTQNEDVNNYLCAANIKWNGVSTMPQKDAFFSKRENTVSFK